VAPTDLSAASNCGGSFFPRFSARRRMPAHAFVESEYAGSTLWVSSRMADNEDATTTLGHSEMARVEHPVRDTIPEVCQAPEEGAKIPSSPRRQDTADIFPNDPPGA